MITIYGVYRSRALRNFWLCEEAGISFRHVPVIQTFRLPDPPPADAPLHTRSAAFLAINPNGQVPTLEEDGLVMGESLAINLHLARRHGGALGPRDAREDGLMTQWTLWAATEVEPRSHAILMNRVQLPPAQREETKVAAAVAALRHPFAVLEAAVADSGHLVGGRFTVADINVAEALRYALPASELFEAAPRAKAWLAACQARPAYRKIVARRDEEPAL